MKIVYVIFLCISSSIFSQNTLRNFGNLKLFESTELGFQTNFINDGVFDKNKGRTGFYGEEVLIISGAFVPQFYDFELFSNSSLQLKVPIEITNDTYFFSGDIKTDKSNSFIYTEWTENATYVGVSNLTKVDGYVYVDKRKEFPFPIGDADYFRPLYLYFQNEPYKAKCAYFFENPNVGNTLQKSFDSAALENTFLNISTTEFWNLETEGSIKIDLTWNPRSNLVQYLDQVNRITVAGWSETRQQWEDLGNSTYAGDIDEGRITSQIFDASEYRIFTFASLLNVNKDLPKNYLVSANGDGINDRLVIPELKRSPKNLLTIFDRNGLKVFEKENYSDEFGGISTVGSVVLGREKGLPDGVYFYVVQLYDLDMEAQGFLYLTR